MSLFEFTTPETPEMLPLREYLNYFILERVGEIENKMIPLDAAYREARAALEACCREIEKHLPEDSRWEMMDRLTSTMGAVENAEIITVYRHGFKDGVAVAKFLMGN